MLNVFTSSPYRLAPPGMDFRNTPAYDRVYTRDYNERR